MTQVTCCYALVLGSLREPYQFFGPYLSKVAAEDAASSLDAVQAGYPHWTIVELQPPVAIRGGDIHKVPAPQESQRRMGQAADAQMAA